MNVRRVVMVSVFAALPVAGAGSSALRQTPAAGAAVERLDYLTFAQGAIPVTIEGSGTTLGVNWERAVRAVDGDLAPFVFMERAPADAAVEIVYELPALTTFDRFAVPNVLETPSPAQTFVKDIDILGSSSSASTGFVPLARRALTTHASRGQVTELTLATKTPVRWVKVRLSGGISTPGNLTSFEFSEIVGNGTQASPELANHFRGAWQTRGASMSLAQSGAIVSGCYDASGDLKGTVSGTILRATGIDRRDKTPSAFILSVAATGELRGVRSSNGGPFRLYTAPKATNAAAVACQEPSPPTLGCGAIIHGISFDFDSAAIRPESAPVLDALFDGLRNDKSQTITVEGHTSSEGTEVYNQRLSENRARAVVGDLVRRGLPAGRLRATGLGETRPIASNNDESGRAMNRRVEIRCQ